MKKIKLLFGVFMLMGLSHQALAWEGSGTKADPYKISKAKDFEELIRVQRNKDQFFVVTAFSLKGTGTKADPYQISKAEDFEEMRKIEEKGNQFFVVTQNIDLKGKDFEPLYLGRGSVFDGQTKVISNLKINGKNYREIGFFLKSFGLIKNVHLKNISVKGNVRNIGGLVGSNHGEIQSSYASGSVTGEWKVGGLVAVNHGEIQNSYASGSDLEGNTVGGLVAVNHGEIQNSYAFFKNLIGKGKSSNSITGKPLSFPPKVGGLVAVNQSSEYYIHDSSISIQNSYALFEKIVSREGFDQEVGSLFGAFLTTSHFNNSFASGTIIIEKEVEVETLNYYNNSRTIPHRYNSSASKERGWFKKLLADEPDPIQNLPFSEAKEVLFQRVTETWDSSVWQLEEGNYEPTLKDLEKN